jgi:choline dehydrogenase-like flavoprotein
VANPTYDVIVVGSGPGGGIAAYALARAGAKVALVEAGPRLVAGRDYNAHLPAYTTLEKQLSKGFRSAVPRVTDYQERDHFTGVGDRPGHGMLRAVGGRSLCWAGHSLRFGPLDYRAWPVTYDAMSPWYSRAERFMGVYGNRDGLSNMPDGEFLPPVAMRCGERMLQTGVEKLKRGGRKMEFVGIRKAMPTAKHASGRAVCHYCGHCMAGCEVDSKYTSANTPIPAALKTGRLTLLTGAMMTRIVSESGGGKLTGIEYESNGERREIGCKALVLSCSAVETARHLLINGLANSSGLVGKNLTSHFGITVLGLFPQLRGRDYSNDDGTDYYHGLLTGMYWDQPNKNFEGTYQVQCGSGVHPLRVPVRFAPGYGVAFRDQLIAANVEHAGMNMQGSLLVSSKKFVDLDPAAKDKYGLAKPRVHLHYEDSDLAMANDCVGVCEEIIRAAGGSVLSTPGQVDKEKLVIDSNHWVGTAKMGTDPRTSVVNPYGRTHDVKNLFLGDASVFAAYPEKNPTLTNIAMTWRMADHLAGLMKKGEL